uniref:Uncharacterized protein n=1 Tax=Cannabis sativa TaxID=3483 RepID=A0A803PLR1_CANSA
MQEAGGLGMMNNMNINISSSGGGDVSISGDQDRQVKAEIVTHPLYEQLLAAHVSCLRVATPIDQLPLIDAQLAQSHHLLRSYASLAHSNNLSHHDQQLQQHVRIHAVEAVMACREIENTLQALTGVSLGEGTGATMSDDEDELLMGQMDYLDQSSGGHGDHINNNDMMMGFGPLLPTESERGPKLTERASVMGGFLTAGNAKGIREPKSSSLPGTKAINSREEYGFFQKDQGILR